MAIAVDPNKHFDYVLKCDRELPQQEQTVYKLKVLTARELAILEDSMTTVSMNGVINVNPGSSTLRILELGLKGWENFKNADGKETPFNEKELWRNWDYLKPEWRREIANAITEQNRLKEEEIKN